MCGIVGIWNVREEDAAARVDTMLDAMRHRGPDGRGTLAYAGGAAGMVRLALVDLSPRGQQPFWSADRRVAILFNGEVYNFREDRERLSRSDFRFRSTTDTEVVLNFYLERGLEFVHRLRGMYSLAIFDWRDSAPGGLPVLLLARSPLGIKPLYIAHSEGDPNRVVFSSEIRALLASQLVPRQIDRESVADYLANGFLLQPRTMISGVRMMAAGSWERYAPGQPVRAETFWRMPPPEPRSETLDEAAERLRSILDESVALHAMADAPVGAFLSGGVDSTGIVGLMRKHIPNLHTYTLRFPEFPEADESQEAIATAQAFECQNTVVDITSRDVKHLLPRFAGELDQPSVDGLNTWMISQAAARDVKCVLSGVGGDEWFAGYSVTRRMARYSTTTLGRAQSIAARLARVVGGLAPPGGLRRRVDNLATRKSPLSTWIQSHSVFTHEVASRMVGLDGPRSSSEARIAAVLDEASPDWMSESAIGLSCLLDTRVYLISQLLRDADATSMASSLELRVPLVDLEVAGFSRSCADEYKLGPGGGKGDQYQASGAKRVLIHALRDVLPPAIVNRPKRGFALPLDQWMQGEFAELAEETCSPETAERRGLVDPDDVRELWRDAKAGVAGTLYPRMWSLMMLELWCRAVIDPPLPAIHPADVAVLR